MIAATRTLDLARAIRFLRRNPTTKGLSQAALSRMCDLSQASISRAEGGRVFVNPRLAHRGLVGLGAPLEQNAANRPQGIAANPSEFETAIFDPPVESHGPQVVVASPTPVRVQVIEPTEHVDQSRVPPVTLVADESGLRLVVTSDASWGVSRESGGTIAWFTI